MPKAEDLTNDGLACHLTDDAIKDRENLTEIVRCAPTNYYYGGFLNLQTAVEYSWMDVRVHNFFENFVQLSVVSQFFILS